MQNRLIRTARAIALGTLFVTAGALSGGCYAHSTTTASLPPGTVRVTVGHAFGGGPGVGSGPVEHDADARIARRR